MGGPVDLVLYVNPQSPTSQRARQTLDRVLAGFRREGVSVAVADVAEDPFGAERDGVLFAPTLVRRRPEPRAWIVGDLADGSAVAALLMASGLEEAR